jgi:hypothetical protein
MAPPRGQFGNRLDTERGRAKEAEMQRAAGIDLRRLANYNPADVMGPSTPITEPPTGGGPPPAPTESEQDRYYRELGEREAAERAAAVESDRQTASAFLRDILSQYGMGDLAGDVDRLVRESGNNTSVLMNNIRQTQSYKDRFKGLLALQQRGITDIPDEASYIGLESQYRQVFRESGIQNFLGDAGSSTERDAIAKIVGDFSLSVNEVRDRVSDAQRVVADTPQEVRDSLQRFYNVDPATLTAYVLDPTRTASEINRRANAAIVGGYAQRQGLEFGAGISERIGSLFAGEGDLQGTQAEPQLTTIAEAARGTKRLAQIEQSALSDEDVALSSLDLDATAKQRVEGLKSRERARFGGSGAFTSTALTGVNKI